MSTRPKTQDSMLKLKSGGQQGDLRGQNHSNSSPPKSLDKAVAEISMKDFLDFLKISYQVNEAIDNSSSEISDKINVDWKKLTSDNLINRLKEREAALNKDKAAAKTKPEVKAEEKPEEIKEEKTPQNEPVSSSEQSSKNPTRQNSEEKLIENKSSAEQSPPSFNSPERTSSTLSLDRKVFTEKPKRLSLGRRKNKKENSTESETSGSIENAVEDRAPAKILKKKLNDVLQEGILDSVLPYLVPKPLQQPFDNSQSNLKKPHSYNDLKKINGNLDKNEKLPGSIKDKLDYRKKSFSKTDSSQKNDKKDIEVVIHVCDEIKNLKRDFRCSQKLLVSQMGYFAEVTTGQKLEDMDISVHCDVTIFDWLMRWVQKENVSEEYWPLLDSSIVIPVLMSSAFLQMNSLQDYCLQYCKNHINDIIRDSPNLSCINDNVLTRLANLFTNTEVESIVDKKDKIQSKLFCKLITALTEPEPQPERGHFSSVATIYRCSKCIKLILRNMSGSILCVPSNMSMDKNGSIYSTHVYDSSWNLTDYVRSLKAELKTWRRVYWRLWADCHFLFCQVCEENFPVHHMSWCRFHTETVQYFPLENQRSVTYPIGRYSCCGEKAYRFEVVKKISGCQYRDHITNPKTSRDVDIIRIWSSHKEVIKEEPPPIIPPERSKYIQLDGSKKSPVKDSFWWEGLELVPSKNQTGLLTKLWDAVMKKDEPKNAGNSENKYQKSPVTKVVTASQASIQDMSSFSDSSDESSSSSHAGNSEESYHPTTGKDIMKSKPHSAGYNVASTRINHIRKEKKRRKKKKKKAAAAKNGNRFWLSKLSTRCNQDNQREFEERALRQIESLLAKKLSGEGFRGSGPRSSYQVVPAGGIYVKLEQEWREAHCFSHGCPGSSIKAQRSSSYVNVHNSSFSMHKRSKSKGQR